MGSVEDPDTNGLITKRRKKQVTKSVDEEDQEDDFAITEDFTAARLPAKDDRKRQNLHAERQSRDAKNLARAQKLNAARKPSQEEAEAHTSIVASILGAHMKAKIAITNCFDQKTVLDFMGRSCAERETMQDMAVAIDTASMVYGYRVDKTHLDAQDTRFTFIRGKKENEGKAAEAVSGEGGASDDEMDGGGQKPKRGKRGQNVVLDDDWQNRYHGLMEGGEERLSPEPDEGHESEESGDDEMDDEDDGADLDNEFLNIRADLDQQLLKIKEQRKKKACRIRVRNRMLEEDDDRLAMTTTELSENDYYQKAVSKHSEGTAASMLLQNARSSGDGRVLYMHSRVTKDDLPPVFDDDIGNEYLNGVRATLCNALSATSARPENDLLPLLDEKPQLLFIRSGNMDGRDYNPMLDSDEDEGEEDADMGTDADSVLPEETMMDATGMQPDRTIMEATMLPDRTMAVKEKQKGKGRRRNNRMRGRDLTEMWIPDKLTMPSTSVSPMNTTEMRRICKRIVNPAPDAFHAPVKKDPTEIEELCMPIEDLWNETKHAEFAGLDDDFRDIDCLWNSTVVEKTVTDDDCEHMLRQAEREGTSTEDTLARKKRVLRPGNYVFFMEPENPVNRLIPVDPWSEEGASAAGYEDIEDDLDDFVDANDSFDFSGGGGGMDEMEDLPQLCSSRSAQQSASEEDAFIKNLIGLNKDEEEEVGPDPALLLAAPCDDVADVPAGPEAVTVNADVALKSLGKLDDAHWKVNQTQPEKKERQKKDKLTKDEQKPDELYFLLSNEVDRAEAISRFKVSKASSLERGEDVIFSRRRATERRPHLAYKFENFTKPGLLFKGKYGGVRFERNISSHPEDSQFSHLLHKMEASEEDGDTNTDDFCREWLSTFGRFRVFADSDDPNINDSFQSAIGSPPIHPVADDDMLDDGGGGMDYDDGPVMGGDVADSFHSAVQDPLANLELARERRRHENLMYELQQVQGEDSDEDEGEMVTMLDRKIVIKNSNIDQSRVKTYLKQILTNPTLDLAHLQKVRHVVEADESGDVLEEVASTSSSEKENVHNVKEKTVDVDMNNEDGFDALDVTSAVYAPAEDPSQPEMFRRPSNAGEDPATQMSSGVILSDFRVHGEHTMQSLYTCLPFKSTRPQEREMHVAFAFSIALQMCNENTLKLEQRRPEDHELTGRAEEWMGDFVVRNASPQPANGNSQQALSQRDNLLPERNSSQSEH